MLQKTGILLLHGLGENSRHWRRVAETLAPDFPVLSFDLPGHGGKPRGDLRPASIAVSVAAEIRAAGWKDAVAVCHSLGSLYGYSTARKFPEVIRGVIAVNSHLFRLQRALNCSPPHNVGASLAAIRLIPSATIPVTKQMARMIARSPTLRRIALSQVLYDPASVDRCELEYALSGNGSWDSPRAANLARKVDLGEIFPEAPMIIHSDHDAIADSSDLEELLHRRPNARVKRISDCGHWTQIEAPENLVNSVRPWIDELLSNGT